MDHRGEEYAPRLGTGGRHGASGAGVQCRSIDALVIDTLKDIDLTAVGPIRLLGLPHCGPGSYPEYVCKVLHHRRINQTRDSPTPLGQMADIKSKSTLSRRS